MLVNASSISIYYVVESHPFAKISPKSSVCLPEEWTSLKLATGDYHPLGEVTPYNVTGEVIPLGDGELLLLCPNSGHSPVYTISDNHLYRLHVRNSTDASYTLSGPSAEITVLPQSTQIMTGCTMIAREDACPAEFFSLNAGAGMMFHDHSTDRAGYNVYVSQDTTLVAFSRHRDDSCSSTVTITTY